MLLLFLDVVIDVELFTLLANFLSPANFALFPLVNFVSSAGQLSLRQLFAPAWKCVDHCDTNTKRNKFLYKYKYSWKHIGSMKGVALIRGYPLQCADTNRQSPMHVDTTRPHQRKTLIFIGVSQRCFFARLFKIAEVKYLESFCGQLVTAFRWKPAKICSLLEN